MITLSNGHRFEYVVASGAAGFAGRYWWFERPLVWFGLIKPELFTIVLKTLTLEPIKGNLNWWKPWTWLPFSPWSCVRHVPGGTVNKVGLTNLGFDWWIQKVAPTIDFTKQPIIVSLHGTAQELAKMVWLLNACNGNLVGIELNVSCPNVGEMENETAEIVNTVKRIFSIAGYNRPIGLKLSVAQDCLAIARELEGYIEYVTLNSVPWEVMHPSKKSLLWRLQQKVGGSGGGVSGQVAQAHNWKVARQLVKETKVPVVFPGVWDYEDINSIWSQGADAISFGAIHLRFPSGVLPTRYVKRDKREQQEPEERRNTDG